MSQTLFLVHGESDFMVKVGDRIRIISDNSSYKQYKNRTWEIEKVSFSREDHPGYDDGLNGQALVDCRNLPFSLYEYEFEIVG